MEPENNQNQNIEQGNQITPSVVPANPQVAPAVSTPSPISNQTAAPVQKKKRHWGCLIFILLILMGLAYLFLIPKVNSYLDNKRFGKNQEIEASTEEKLKADYKVGRISKEVYLKNLTYSVFNNEKLDSKYKSSQVGLPADVLGELGRLGDDLSEETKKEIAATVMERNFRLEPEVLYDSDGKVIIKNSKAFKIEAAPALAGSGKEKESLNEAIISPSGHFIVWFTQDKKNRNYVSKNNAQKIARDVDAITNNYLNKLGLEFNVDFKYFNPGILDGGINPSEIYTKSKGKIPIYLVEADEHPDWAAFYGSSLFPSWLGAPVKSIQTSHQVFPFIVLNPSQMSKYSDLRVLASHELAHLAQDTSCSWKYECRYNSSEMLEEGTAQLLAALENPNNQYMAPHFLNYYISDIHPEEKRGGGTYTALTSAFVYGPYSFYRHFSEKMGVKTVFEQFKNKSNPLKNLIATNFASEFANLAERNILNNYPENTFNSSFLPKPKYSFSGSEYGDVDPLAINYQYIKKNQFKDKEILISKTPTGSLSDPNLQLLIMGRENNLLTSGFSKSFGFKTIYKEKMTKEKRLKTEDLKDYEEILIAVVNPEESAKGAYSITLESAGIDSTNGNQCVVYNYDDWVKMFTNLMKLSKEVSKVAVTKDSTGETKDMVKLFGDLEKKGEQFDKTDSKNALFCSYEIKMKEKDKRSMHQRMINSMGGLVRFTIADFEKLENHPGDRISLGLRAGLTKSDLKFMFVLSEANGQDSIIEITFID